MKGIDVPIEHTAVRANTQACVGQEGSAYHIQHPRYQQSARWRGSMYGLGLYIFGDVDCSFVKYLFDRIGVNKV